MRVEGSGLYRGTFGFINHWARDRRASEYRPIWKIWLLYLIAGAVSFILCVSDLLCCIARVISDVNDKLTYIILDRWQALTVNNFGITDKSITGMYIE